MSLRTYISSWFSKEKQESSHPEVLSLGGVESETFESSNRERELVIKDEKNLVEDMRIQMKETFENNSESTVPSLPNKPEDFDVMDIYELQHHIFSLQSSKDPIDTDLWLHAFSNDDLRHGMMGRSMGQLMNLLFSPQNIKSGVITQAFRALSSSAVSELERDNALSMVRKRMNESHIKEYFSELENFHGCPDYLLSGFCREVLFQHRPTEKPQSVLCHNDGVLEFSRWQVQKEIEKNLEHLWFHLHDVREQLIALQENTKVPDELTIDINKAILMLNYGPYGDESNIGNFPAYTLLEDPPLTVFNLYMNNPTLEVSDEVMELWELKSSDARNKQLHVKFQMLRNRCLLPNGLNEDNNLAENIFFHSTSAELLHSMFQNGGVLSGKAVRDKYLENTVKKSGAGAEGLTRGKYDVYMNRSEPSVAYGMKQMKMKIGKTYYTWSNYLVFAAYGKDLIEQGYVTQVGIDSVCDTGRVGYSFLDPLEFEKRKGTEISSHHGSWFGAHKEVSQLREKFISNGMNGRTAELLVQPFPDSFLHDRIMRNESGKKIVSTLVKRISLFTHQKNREDFRDDILQISDDELYGYVNNSLSMDERQDLREAFEKFVEALEDNREYSAEEVLTLALKTDFAELWPLETLASPGYESHHELAQSLRKHIERHMLPRSKKLFVPFKPAINKNNNRAVLKDSTIGMFQAKVTEETSPFYDYTEVTYKKAP